jgi:hypothetical protein
MILLSSSSLKLLIQYCICDVRIPKLGSLDEGRKTIPSFAGNTQFGFIDPETKSIQQQRPQQQQQQQQAFPQPQQQQQAFPQQQQPFQQRQQQPSPPQQQPAFPSQQQQPAPQLQQQQQPAPQQQGFQQGLNTFQASNPANQPLSLFDQIKNKINQQGGRQQQQPAAAAAPPPPPQPPQQPPQQPQQQQPQVQQPRPQLLSATAGQQTFGPFEAVSLNNALQGSERPRVIASPRSRLADR